MGIRSHRNNDRAVGKIEQTAQGGYRIPGAIGRVGVLKYRMKDGSIRREYRPPEEVFAPESLATLRSAPVTRGHPPPGVRINPENFKKYSVGHFEGDPIIEDDRYVVGTIIVQDGDTLRGIESGEEDELSGGYDSKADLTPGVSPEGEEYDVIQRNIVYNHVAIVPKGRAGSEVSLRLDAEDNEIPDPTGSQTEWTMDPQKMMEEIARLKAENDALKAKLGETETVKTDAEKKADQASKDAAEATKALEEGTSPEKLDQMVEEKKDAIDALLSVDPKAEYKGKTTREIRLLALEKADPEFRRDSVDKMPKSEQGVYIGARFAGVFSRRPSDPNALRRAAVFVKTGGGEKKPLHTDAQDDGTPKLSKREKMIEDNRSRGQAPLTASKK